MKEPVIHMQLCLLLWRKLPPVSIGFCWRMDMEVSDDDDDDDDDDKNEGNYGVNELNFSKNLTMNQYQVVLNRPQTKPTLHRISIT